MPKIVGSPFQGLYERHRTKPSLPETFAYTSPTPKHSRVTQAAIYYDSKLSREIALQEMRDAAKSDPTASTQVSMQESTLRHSLTSRTLG